MRHPLYLLLVLLALPAQAQEFAITFDRSKSAQPLDGRVLLMLSTDNETEPRFQVRPGVRAIQIFGIDVESLAPGETALIDGDVFGYPKPSLAEVPPGEYVVQALLNRYETFTLATGHTVELPPDRGEGQQWRRKPGNLYSTPRTVRIDAQAGGRIEIVLDQKIPEIEPPADTEWVRHVRLQSDLLTEFWGRPVELGAHVLLPKGFEEHPDARYPLMIFHGHFHRDFGGFRTTPPDTTADCVYSERFQVDCYNRIAQQEAYDFYRTWTSDDFPRFIIIEVQHPTPYYDASYAVNSASQGPHGDAIMRELVPYIEEQFRGIGEGWARFTYGGSTGGWQALASQIFYPDDLNGVFAACPDPIDFRAYLLVDIYTMENAYRYGGTFRDVEIPGSRNWLGEVDITMRDWNHLELVLGSKGRSGGPFDMWQATYSPVGEDGYPKPIWDKLTGEIDHEVAAYWRENYDLRHILERDWETLGPKLEGKIHLYIGDMDNYYLNNAVYLTEEFLESTTDPYYAGIVDYGDRAEHCWNGDHTVGIHLSSRRYNTMYVSRILERIQATAPPGADLSSWRY